MKENKPILLDIHMLATDKASNLILHKKELKAYSKEMPTISDGLANPQHLYAVSDEEIKKKNWAFSLKGKKIETIFQVKEITSYSYVSIEGYSFIRTSCKKIVATTNPELWGYTGHEQYNPVAKIPTTFLQPYIEAYNSGKKIEQVRLETEEVTWRDYYC